MVDETQLEERLAEEVLAGWEVIPTGSGFLVTTGWRWPNDEMIEIHVNRVADRDDLYVVTDGGELINNLFSAGIDLQGDSRNMDLLHRIASRSDAGIVDYRIVKGANNENLAHSIRLVLEAVKEGAFVFWQQLA